ncbi:MAG: 3-oxoacyl-ACP reductase family protein, partial [Terrimicrobiaceae bacterium]
MITLNLEGKTALVTGGGQGLGEQTARTLHRAGAHTVVSYFGDAQGLNRDKAERLAEELGAGCCALEGDVRDPAAAERVAAETASRFGVINILVNNAGVLRDRTVAKMSAEEWQTVIDTNLTGVFTMTKACLPHLAAGGRIINMASIAAFVGFFGQSNYAAAKAGVIGLTRVLSRELGRKGITVNAIAPGVVLTEMGKSIPEEVRAEMLKQIPLGKFGEPQDIA